ncbi:MarR family winged helix-turn-helix transcriptional regulator [Pseudonocardia abyssalis]|uniref:MarR family transcriptional regulator n=1 Tax=Pseudonocardia abyssalis TaxID=2792008 RepID=A0ABS6V0B7_9PSEU|nr:MarR family transcriptional regulator [Pseudonocardia abyssalis]MBW0118224.1 MarR family transcriptional regulator [Pseudonocardia abyssalis]MBW0137852.1 MarR family transcriptional regulator [Pseudonocardia abyssalis]
MAQSESAWSMNLDEQLCFSLYAASRAMISCYRPQLDAVGITYPQYLVMLVLWEREEATVTSIGAALQLETGTLSPLLKRLEAAGFVDRRRQETDERSVLVSLTAAGRELRERVPDIQRRVGLATGLTHDDIAELRRTLDDLSRQLRAAGVAQPTGTDTPTPPRVSAP